MTERQLRVEKFAARHGISTREASVALMLADRYLNLILSYQRSGSDE